MTQELASEPAEGTPPGARPAPGTVLRPGRNCG